MRWFEKLGVGWLLLKELRGLRRTLEIGIDSEREMRGFDPLFKSEPVPAGSDAVTSPAATDPDPEHEPAEPSWLLIDLIETLAREQHIQLFQDTDLIALAKSRGWIDEDGELVVMPKDYAGNTI